ncbi:MAG: hypothetical protein FAZ92_03481 [Accumulibacter sp.]|nr:MAG: hypothetical protein FAZ92_03481 [Accumulibacter sp.]
MPREGQRSLQPVAVRQQADLHEDTLEFDALRLAAGPIGVDEAVDLLPVARDLGGQRLRDHLDVRQAEQLLLQHRVGAQAGFELEQRDMADDAGEVDRRLDARVAATDDGHPLALEQRAVAVRAIGDAMATVLLLAGDVHLAPARAGGDDHRPAAQAGAAGQAYLGKAVVAGGDQCLGTLQVHDVDLVLAHVLLEPGSQLRTVGLLDRNEVLDRQRIEHLATKTLADDAGAHALARGVDRGCGAGRSAADDEDIEGRPRRDLLRLALRGTDIDPADDLLERHPPLPEVLAVEQDGWHTHDLPLADFGLEQRAIDHLVADAGVDHRHQVERLHDVGTVVAGQRDEGLEVEPAGNRADLVEHARLDLRRMAAGLQQGEDQRGELVPHRDAGKADARRLADAGDGERRPARGIAVRADADLGRQLGDFLHQSEHLARLRAVVERGDEFDRLLDLLQVGAQLVPDVAVEHDCFSIDEWHGKGAAKLCFTAPLRWHPRVLPDCGPGSRACSGG